MKLLIWNNANPTPRARHQTSVFNGERGWMSRKISAPPVRGEKCSLTSPFIEQAFALTTGGQGVLAVFEHFERTLLARPSPRSYFMKCFSNRTCERFAPFSVSKTDFAFVAGSEM